jgi:type IV pilus assembly protein PilC
VIVLAISEGAVRNFPLVFVGVVTIVVGTIMFRRTESGRMFFDTLLLKMPIFGEIMMKVVFARFFQTLATLIRSGNDVVSSLEIAARVADNAYIEAMIVRVKSRVVEGAMISEEMDKLKVFPRMVARMTAVGEKSGQMDEMFEKISNYYADEVDAAVNAMSSIIEPVLIVFLGGIIGIVVVAMYLPIFKIGMAMTKQ